MDKFKDQEALQKAYESLEKEFTRRSQRLRELQKKIEQGTLIEQKTCIYKQAKELDFVWWECSDCGSGFNFYANTPYQNRFHYCPYCGAKIIECKEKDNGYEKFIQRAEKELELEKGE